MVCFGSAASARVNGNVGYKEHVLLCCVMLVCVVAVSVPLCVVCCVEHV